MQRDTTRIHTTYKARTGRGDEFAKSFVACMNGIIELASMTEDRRNPGTLVNTLTNSSECTAAAV